MYLYRLAETKAKQIGTVSRLMKEINVDCQLNISQTNFTAEKLQQVVENQQIEIELTNDTNIKFTPGVNYKMHLVMPSLKYFSHNVGNISLSFISDNI